MIDPAKLAEELSDRGLEWADKDAAFKALDETTKSVLSQAISNINADVAHNKAESEARRSTLYREHLDALANSRREANRAKVKYDTFKVYVDLKRSALSFEKAQMGIL